MQISADPTVLACLLLASLAIVGPSHQFPVASKQRVAYDARWENSNFKLSRPVKISLSSKVLLRAQRTLNYRPSVEHRRTKRDDPTSLQGKWNSGVYRGDSLAQDSVKDTRFPTLDSTSTHRLSAGKPQRRALHAPRTDKESVIHTRHYIFPSSRERGAKDEQTESGEPGKRGLLARLKEFVWGEVGRSGTKPLQSEAGQVRAGHSVRGKHPNKFSRQHQSASGSGRVKPGDQFTEVVEVDVTRLASHHSRPDQDTDTSVTGSDRAVLKAYNTADSDTEHPAHRTSNTFHNEEAKSQPAVSSGSGGGVFISKAANSANNAVEVNAAVQPGHSEALEQAASEGEGDNTHVSRMVLTVAGSLIGLLGVSVMAAIFQCCCRKKRRGGQHDDALNNKKDQAAGDSKRSRSKSPSPQKAPQINVDRADDRHSERDILIEDDEELGDFSVVQRETEILRSYRKPPPPKNRARASRVPRALKTADPNENPNIFKELVEQEEKQLKEGSPAKTANGLTRPEKEGTPSSMNSSMLADIDSTLAALHEKNESELAELRKTIAKDSSSQSREASVEKGLSPEAAEPSSSVAMRQMQKSNGKEDLPRAMSREELAKSIAKGLSKAVTKEAVEKAAGKTASPKVLSRESSKAQDSQKVPSKELPRVQDSPKVLSKDVKEPPTKSRSAGASPMLKSKEKDLKTSKSQDNVSDAKSQDSVSGAAEREKATEGTGATQQGEETEKQGAQNVFALIDPTVGKEKSKIPVRASISPAQPVPPPLRPAADKDHKRFSVPVRGEGMDKLMKSLKTRLNEDSSAKRPSNKETPEDDTSDDLEPHSRDRSYSDPTKQQEEEKEQKHFHQTHL